MNRPEFVTPQAITRNPLTLLEYDPIKLLNKPHKLASVFEVRDGTRDYDPLFPLSVELHLTDVCNLRCSWCTDLELRRNLASLPLATVEALFREFAQHEVGVTIEGGGEPTVYKHFSEVVALAARYRLGIGYVMTRRNTTRLLEFIEEMNAAGVDYIYLRPVEEMPDLAWAVSQGCQSPPA